MFSSLPFSYMFLFVMGTGTLLSVSSIHWLSIWAGLEINLIGFLPMLIYQKSISESESAVKYFIVQALGSSFLMFGSLLAFNSSFSWNMHVLSYLGNVGLIMLMVGLCVKLGLFPFHYWLPSVMAGLPWMSCLLLATWQKFAPLFLMLSLLDLNYVYMTIFMFSFMSMGSSLIGGFGGINQTQVRALLAYSSIGHLGWMTFAALHSEWSLKVYFIIYIMISVSVFLSLWLSDSGTMKNINNLKVSMFLQMSVMLLLLSLGGLPPLLGFIPKLMVIMISSSMPWLYVIMIMILGSLMSLFYYLSLFFSFFLSTSKKQGFNSSKTDFNSLIVMINVFNLFGGVIVLTIGLMNVF
uniref:NADH-ubiquinone oxidoreductase chain 2 n=1 Tax=Splendrillia sp. 1 MNHN IM 2013-9619 TaxID=2259841 RepID=A0A344H1L1_9CAEN|nr:NADH dehydrogenase subunit 2 [Splendrillia sp. 1 MNHN IM 2013-9619]AXA45276.1 NADH dehydrogenase subunit 2 [Splendrillia sp. 1 MNHN IM 2013-9619]